MKYITSVILVVGCFAMAYSVGVPHANCPPDNDYYHSFAHDTDCSKYYVCDWGKAIEKPCAAGLVYNPTSSVCDWPASAATGGAVCQNATVPPPQNQCPPANEYYHSYAHDTDCHKYYVCNWGKGVEMPCSSGLVFNPSVQVCDWPNNAIAGGAVCSD